MHRLLSRRLLVLPLLGLAALPAAGQASPAATVAAHAPLASAATPAPSRVPVAGVTVSPPSTATPAATSSAAASTAAAAATTATLAAPRRSATPAPTASPAPTATASPTAAPATPRAHDTWGVYQPGAPGDMSALAPLESELGAVPDEVMWYVHWGGGSGAFSAADVDSVISHGETPVITWMSDDYTTSSDVYPLQQIAAGVFDSYVKSWADGLRSIHHHVLLRFDHEMNGNWSQWSTGVAGQTPADYVAAWRHVHDVFAAEGASNVTWVWSPNVVYTGSTALALLYPGDGYVDVIGLDGYNWGPTDQWHTWQSFAQVFLPTVAQVQLISHRPLMVSEVGCTTVGGDKAQWITDMFTTLRQTPAITGFVWFDVDKEQDWRIDSSPATTAAFKAGLATL